MSDRIRGYKAGTKAVNTWNVGDVEPQPDLAESDDYRIGFNEAFVEKAEYKIPLRNLPVGPIPPDVDFAEMEQAFNGDDDVNLSKKKRKIEKDDGPDDF